MGTEDNQSPSERWEPPETPFILPATWIQVLPKFSLGLKLVKQTPVMVAILDH